MEQQELAIMEEERDRAAGFDLLQATRAAVENIGQKVVADALKVDLSIVSRCLRGDENRSVRVEWLPAIDRLDPERRVTRLFAARAGCVLTKKRALTPEQQNAALRRALKSVLGAKAAALVMEEAGVEP